MSAALAQCIARAHEVIDTVAPDLIRIGADIHANPELAGQERRAVRWLTELAERHGFHVRMGLAGFETAFIGEPAGNRPEGPLVAFLSEYDALPGLGHACGHNLIGIAGLGAALGTAASASRTGGRIRWVGTPAEEGLGGKVAMAEAGLFNDVDAAMMVHPDFRNEIFVSTLGMTEYRIVFHGKPAHAAAAPEEGINALDAMITLFNHVGLMRQQVRDDARLHGIIIHGGDAANIIPARTEARFLVRAKGKSYHGALRSRFEACVAAAAQATGCRVEYEARLTYDPLNTNEALGRLFHISLAELGVVAPLRPLDGGLGSSDIGNVSNRCPTIHPLIDVGLRPACSHHTPEFEKVAGHPSSYQATLRAAKAMASTALRFFSDADARLRVREEFLARRVPS